MDLFNVYPRFNIQLERASGVYVYDEKGTEYLDLYGGHGVISIGHSHPHYVKSVTDQLNKIGFYSNSVLMPIQEQLANKLGQLSEYDDYHLFLCNSGAEGNENALKVASFHTGKNKVVAFKHSFHGRTEAALNVTDNAKLKAPINESAFPVELIDLNDEGQLSDTLKSNDVCAVIIEGIQGVGGLNMPTDNYLQFLEKECKAHGVMLILDEIQSGFGRSGKFFAHQHAGIKADIISMAKGMGNGFPVAGVLINPEIQASSGMLGTTFGGNHLACAAALSVLETIENERLMENAETISKQLIAELKQLPKIKKIKGRGLMIGVELDEPISQLRSKILNDYKIFTGNASNPNVLRILPPLGIKWEQVQPFVEALKKELA
ncbi:aspartate aminotransferase family protein [Fulvivirga lutimaris]|uniref:aspartate aminotransferase family protein n=1 Tax=Fulvivirga lutimaris TaxID=1819566 RepID=UPI0012BB760A|nr:aminotransferase class III-fold pyridoxal phosphate-dependent enzyme [Fulvivirga lutimaris]MTI41685.1 aspartate aminotransferase family protein [Fulvivirga lutimaris]